MKRVGTTIGGFGLALLLVAACSSEGEKDGGAGNANTSGTTGGGSGGSGGTGNPQGGTGTSGTGNPQGGTGTAGSSTAGTGTAGTGTAGTGNPVGGGAGTSAAGTGPAGNGGSGVAGTGVGGDGGGSGPQAGTGATAGTGTAGTGGGSGEATGPDPAAPAFVTSSPSGYWQTNGTLADSTANATTTVNDTMEQQTWAGFGGAFNELGWKYLNTPELQMAAIKLLFSASEGANFQWGRIPMGASDYGESRYTYEGADDPTPNGETNRPAADPNLANFSIARDEMKLIPYIQAAQALRPGLRFWASPWTPPTWMKTGYGDTSDCNLSSTMKPSFFDGGNMKSDASVLQAYAQYFVKFVDAYEAKGIHVEIVSAQNEPGYEQNYPSCLWDSATYVNFIKTYLGPAMQAKGVGVMLGTMSNAGDCSRNDVSIGTAVLNDATAASFLTVAGAQWGVLDKVRQGQKFGNLPIWATEHKCGNYPWNPSGYPAYVMTAPNDQAYAEESWGYLKGAIVEGKVTAYNAWNMVLDKVGLGNDTTRHWAQNALLIVDGGQLKQTPTYHVFRHIAQYTVPGAKVVSTTGGDAVAFKNPDGSLVAVMYSSAANANYVVAIGGKKYQFSMPAKGWATVLVRPGA